jgi:rfaE bifunctional protein nucleotidyltransferase chain/domain
MPRTTPPGEKVLALPALIERLAPRRAGGERLALTNGWFDLLHRGHIRYLRAAAELADVLVVGVNSDASVRGLKGPGRPLVAEDERAELLAALACVDYVTIFDAPTAEDLVRALRPEVYVKGGDYAGRPLPEAALAEALGGEFRMVEFVPGSSTSELVRRIRASLLP